MQLDAIVLHQMEPGTLASAWSCIKFDVNYFFYQVLLNNKLITCCCAAIYANNLSCLKPDIIITIMSNVLSLQWYYCILMRYHNVAICFKQGYLILLRKDYDNKFILNCLAIHYSYALQKNVIERASSVLFTILWI